MATARGAAVFGLLNDAQHHSESSKNSPRGAAPHPAEAPRPELDDFLVVVLVCRPRGAELRLSADPVDSCSLQKKCDVPHAVSTLPATAGSRTRVPSLEGLDDNRYTTVGCTASTSSTNRYNVN